MTTDKLPQTTPESTNRLFTLVINSLGIASHIVIWSQSIPYQIWYCLLTSSYNLDLKTEEKDPFLAFKTTTGAAKQ